MTESDGSVLLHVAIDVRVIPEQMLAYPTIATLPPNERAVQLVTNSCIEDLRWLTGVVAVEKVEAHITEYGMQYLRVDTVQGVACPEFSNSEKVGVFEVTPDAQALAERMITGEK